MRGTSGTWGTTIEEVVSGFNNQLVNDEIFSKHREVMFVCHSLGGLIVQRLLIEHREYAPAVKFLYLFASPETGSEVAKLGTYFSRDPLLKTLLSGDENVYLQSLEDDWRTLKPHIQTLCAYEKKPLPVVGVIVDRLSSTRNCDDFPIEIDGDHNEIVKPDSARHPSYIALRVAIRTHPLSVKQTQRSPAASVPNPATPKAQGQPLKPQVDLPPAAVMSVQTDAMSLIKRYSESIAHAYSQKRHWTDPTRNIDRTSIPFHTQVVDKEFNQKYRKFYESEVVRIEGELIGQIKRVPPVPTGFPERDNLYFLRSDSVVSPEEVEGQILDICSLLGQMQGENGLPTTCSEKDLKYKFHPDQYPNRSN